MHRAAVVTFAFLIVSAGVGAPAIAHAGIVTGDSDIDPVAEADAVLVGQAQEARSGRVVNGCQLTTATVKVEEVILGELPPGTSGDLTVEFVGDCSGAGTLGEEVPAQRAVWFLINKGAWLREFVVPRSGDWTAEDALWRPLRPDAIAVDDAGALGKYGAGPSWLHAASFASLVSELRESGYMRQNYAQQSPVGLGIWFSVQAYLAAAAFFGVALLAALASLIGRGRVRRSSLVVAGVALAGAGVSFVGGPRLARTVDFAAGIAGRTAVVQSVRAGTLEHVEYDDYALPTGLENLSRDRVVQAIPGPPSMAFFLTQAFFSPDPYCGYEYAQVPEALELDPLGSGAGRAEDLGDGWYWICAS